MDPRAWPTEHKIALGIAVAAGAVLAIGIGFGLSDATQFGKWLLPTERIYYLSGHYPRVGGIVAWGAPGAFIGAAVVYLVKLLR